MDKLLIKNIISMTTLQGANSIIPLLVLPYLVQVLAPEGYGMLGFAIALTQYFCILTDYGFNYSVMQKISIARKCKTRVSELFWTVLVCKMILFVLGLGILLLLIFSLPFFFTLRWTLIAAYSSVLGSVLFPMWLFQGKEKMAGIAVASIVAKLLTLAPIFLLVNDQQDVWIAALITGCTSVITGLVCLYCVRRWQWIRYVRPTIPMIIKEFREGAHVFLSQVAVSFYTTSTTVLLGLMAGPAAVGYYVAADKIRQALQSLLLPIYQAYFPRVVATLHKDRIIGFRLIRRLLLLLSGTALVMSVVLSLYAKKIITLLYGADYEISVNVLTWLAWLPFIVSFSHVFGVQTLLVLGNKKYFSGILLSSGVINLVMLLIFIPRYHAVGAAIAVFITEITVTILMFMALHQCHIPLFKWMRAHPDFSRE